MCVCAGRVGEWPVRGAARADAGQRRGGGGGGGALAAAQEPQDAPAAPSAAPPQPATQGTHYTLLYTTGNTHMYTLTYIHTNFVLLDTRS